MSLLDGPAINSSVIRKLNRSTILRTILERGPISRIEIARINGLTQSTVSRIVEKLIEKGLVYEQSKVAGNLGRKPINLAINEQSHIIGVIAISPSTTTIALTDLAGNELNLETIPTDTNPAETFISDCAGKLNSMIASQNIPLAGVGITVPGIVNPTTGTLLENESLNCKDLEIQRLIKAQIEGRILVENTAKAGALAEICFMEEALNLSNFVLVHVGRQIEAES